MGQTTGARNQPNLPQITCGHQRDTTVRRYAHLRATQHYQSVTHATLQLQATLEVYLVVVVVVAASCVVVTQLHTHVMTLAALLGRMRRLSLMVA